MGGADLFCGQNLDRDPVFKSTIQNLFNKDPIYWLLVLQLFLPLPHSSRMKSAIQIRKK